MSYKDSFWKYGSFGVATRRVATRRIAILAALAILSCAPSGGLEEGASGIQTDQSKTAPPPQAPAPDASPPPAGSAPAPAQPTGEFTQGTIRTFFGDGSPEVIEFPRALAMDSNDNLFVSAQRGVFKITPAKEISMVVQTGASPPDIALDSQGNLFFLDVLNPSRLHKIKLVDRTQTIVTENLTFPRGLLVTGNGRIIVSQADPANNVVEVLPGGALTPIAGNGLHGFSGDGGPATEAQLNKPGGLAIDSSGKIHICDIENKRVRVVGADGKISTVFNGNIDLAFPLSSEPRTGFPFRILENSNLSIPLILAAEGHRVIDLKGNPIAGNGSFGFSGDGGPAEGAQLSNPSGLAMDSKGFLYIADFNNNRIRIVNPKRGAGTPFIQ